MSELKYADITEKIIGASMKVHATLVVVFKKSFIKGLGK